MLARELFVTMLQWADDQTLENLLAVPALEFCIPCPGLQWVQYVGKGCGRVNGKVIAFDGSKIQGVRCLSQEVVEMVGKEQEDFKAEMDERDDLELSLADDLARDTNVEPNEENSGKGLGPGLI
jgi:hypothetical protein